MIDSIIKFKWDQNIYKRYKQIYIVDVLIPKEGHINEAIASSYYVFHLFGDNSHHFSKIEDPKYAIDAVRIYDLTTNHFDSYVPHSDDSTLSYDELKNMS